MIAGETGGEACSRGAAVDKDYFCNIERKVTAQPVLRPFIHTGLPPYAPTYISCTDMYGYDCTAGLGLFPHPSLSGVKYKNSSSFSLSPFSLLVCVTYINRRYGEKNTGRQSVGKTAYISLIFLVSFSFSFSNFFFLFPADTISFFFLNHSQGEERI